MQRTAYRTRPLCEATCGLELTLRQELTKVRGDRPSSAGAVDVEADLTDAIMPGVLSIPPGWGYKGERVQLRVAGGRAGARSNVPAPPDLIDPLSGNAVLNGIPVTVARA